MISRDKKWLETIIQTHAGKDSAGGRSDMSQIEIPGYRIEKRIGRGGMASVYLATQESLNRKVAVKLLKDPEIPGFSERFLNEARFIASLNHVHIVTIHDVGQVDNYYFITMEYMPGGDLKSRIKKGISREDALRVTKKIAEALDFIHSREIVHRDIKPANIMFRADGSIVLTDFGISKHLQQDCNLTVTGEIIGTPTYISPEQALNTKCADSRSDIYSLGVIMFEMLTGKKPYTGDSYAGVIFAHQNEPIPALPEALEPFQEIIDKMMAKNPDERFQSGMEIIEAIRRRECEKLEETAAGSDAPASSGPVLHSGMPVKTRTEKKDTSAPKKRALALAAGLFLLVLAGVFSAHKVLGPQTLKSSGGIPPGNISGADRDFEGFWGEISGSAGSLSSGTRKEIRSLLEQAQKAIEQYRLTSPKGDNALHYLQRVLELHPEDRRAEAGMEKIATAYADLAQQEMDKFQYQKADGYIELGLGIDPDHKRLLGLKQEVEKSAPKRIFNTLKRLVD